METRNENKGANKVTKNTKVNHNGTTLRIEKSWTEGPKGGEPDCWDIVNSQGEISDRFERLWHAKAQMERYIQQGGEVVA